MNLKDRMIRKLLDVGKKHRILVYPTLALIAVISAISNAVYISKTNGKRTVASFMVVALLLTQSIFLTSSADTGDSAPLSGQEASSTDAQSQDTNLSTEVIPETTEEISLQGASSTVNVNYVMCYIGADGSVVYDTVTSDTATLDEGDSTYKLASVLTGTDAYAAKYGSADTNLVFSPVYGNTSWTNTITTSTDIATAATADGSDYDVYFYVTRNGVKLTISDTDTASTDSVTLSSSNTTQHVYDECSGTVEKGTSGFYYKRGYTFNGITLDGTHYDVGSSIAYTPTSLSDGSITATADWSAMDITVTVNGVGGDQTGIITLDDTDPKTIACKYSDTGITLPSFTLASGVKEGYYIDYYEDASGNKFYPNTSYTAEDLAENLGELTDATNVQGKTLTAHWSYKTLVWSDGTQTLVVNTEYGSSLNNVDNAIYAAYDDGTTHNFTYEISSDVNTELNTKYGIAFYNNPGNTFTLSSALVKDVTNGLTGGAYTFPVTVTDNNTDASDVNHTTTLYISLVAAQKTVSLDPESIMDGNDATKSPYKTYDGNANIGVATTARVISTDLVNGDTNATVSVTLDKDALFMKNGSESADTGTKDIKLTGVTLAGASADKYKFDSSVVEGVTTVADRGRIDQVAVTVELSLDSDSDDSSVYFGEETPKYTVSIANPEVLPTDLETQYNACTTNDERIAFLVSNCGLSNDQSTWTSRTLYSPKGNYTVEPVFSSSNNIKVVREDAAKDTLTVVRDSGTDAYTILSEKNEFGYYPEKLTISANSTDTKYDKIRWVEDGKDIAEGTAKSTVAALFTNSTVDITDDMYDKTIYIQMYDTETGAVTELVPIDNVSIDLSAPVLSDVSVSNLDYINNYKFGSYYHKQTIDGTDVEMITINFEYTAENSDCDKLHYYFTDDAGNKSGENTVDFTDEGSNKYSAKVTFGTGQWGQLVVYATDEGGNKSTESRISIEDAIAKADDFDSVSDYYEWMVENVISNTATITVKDSDGTAANTSTWYNDLTATTTVEEPTTFVNGEAKPQSGVQKIIWHITDPSGTVTDYEDKTLAALADKTTKYTFSTGLAKGAEGTNLGEYKVSATWYDNAGNSTDIAEVGTFKIDDVKPTYDDSATDWESGNTQGINWKFTANEGEDESGLASIVLYKVNGSSKEEKWAWSVSDEDQYSKDCEYEVTENGEYLVVITDKAGNVNEVSKAVTGISNVIPEPPTISVSPEKNSSGWYTSTPYVTVKANNTIKSGKAYTTDNMLITTNYSVKVPNNTTTNVFNKESYNFKVESEGEVDITAQNVSASGCKSQITTDTLKIDTVKPVVTITGSSVDSDGNLVISFDVKDTTSGVDVTKVTINGDMVLVSDPTSDGVVSGTFTAEDGVDYEIIAKDVAGNESEPVEFNSLGLTVDPITDITTNSALLTADIIVGTYPLSDWYIAYREHTDDDSNAYARYNLVAVNDVDNVKELTCPFKNLDPDTEYDYKVYATTKVSQETKSYEGTFKTGSANSSATIYGDVSYSDSLPDTEQTYPLYVSLTKGGVSVGGVTLDEEGDYMFKNVADGAYQITATNGKLTKTAAVTVTNGGISYPTDYSLNGGVNFVLSGLCTSVDIEDDAIDVTADDLDCIYDDVYRVVVTDDDYDTVDDGGNVLITLHARYLNVASDVTSTEQGIFEDKLGENAEIVRYIELYVTKTVTDKDGNSTTTNVSELPEAVTVSFPLDDLAGQKIYVASLHGSDSDYTFYNWGSASDVSLSNDYVTITTRYFSVYALYKINASEKTYTVKWVDGDGNVMKTETVKEGSSATPPTKTPTKTATDKYTYTFEKWDQDYSNVSEDMIILAWFTANKIDKSDDKGGSSDNGKTTEATTQTTEKQTTESQNNNTPSTKVTPGTNTTEPEITTTATRYTYLGTAGGTGSSPKTGDNSPIVLISVVMIVAFAGIAVITIKKKRSK